ncbi:hypothetical protein [Mycobacterium ahvazicum]|uniref:hypothetical protein n=1 Tax=Mycobacterium ahvazicum TaxID=1964395 RepID=UPI001FAEB803|nr:hypothetical protein [Mycobacterium ahvazicum]
MLVEQLDIRDGAQARADVILEERPGGEVGGERGGAAAAHHQVPAHVVVQLRQIPAVDVMRAVDDQLVEDSGEEVLENLCTAGQQAVQVLALRHTPAGYADVGQRVALHHRHHVIELTERPSGQQTGHARSQYHRVHTDLRHSPPPVLSVYLTKAMLLTADRGRQRSRLRDCYVAATHRLIETSAKPPIRCSRTVIVAE